MLSYSTYRVWSFEGPQELGALPRYIHAAAQEEGIHQPQAEVAMGEERVGECDSRTLSSGQHPAKQFQSTEYHSASELGGSAFAVPTPRLAASLPMPVPVPVKATSTMTTSVKDLEKRNWNTSGLGLRIASDAASAGSAAVLIAPIITAIDRGIIENASGRNTLANSLKASARDILFRPRSFFGGTAFGLVFVCDSTFVTFPCMHH